MTLIAPDEFRDELAHCSEDEVEDLRAAGIALHDRGIARDVMRRKLEEAGWSHEFSDWYATQIELNGPNFELRVTSQSEIDARMEEYRRACKRKQMLMNSGWFMAAAGLCIRIVVSVAMGPAAKTPAGQNDPSQTVAIFALVAWIASFMLWFKGLWNVLDAKGQSRWWSLIGVFVALVPDRNLLFEPRVSSFAGGSSKLSNW